MLAIPFRTFLPSIADTNPLCPISSTEFKLGIYIRIVRCFLEEEDSTSAETYFNRATLLAHTTVDMTTQLQFKLCQARMFDFSRRFAEASSKYHELSYNSNIAEEERIFCLCVLSFFLFFFSSFY